MASDLDEWRKAEDLHGRPAGPSVLERRAWTLVALVGLALVVTSLQELVVGPADPTPAFSAAPAFFRGHLYLVIALGVVVTGLAAGSLRRGERWAWGLLWLVPAAMLGVALENRAVDGTLWSAQLALAVVGAAGLLLSAREVLELDQRT